MHDIFFIYLNVDTASCLIITNNGISMQMVNTRVVLSWREAQLHQLIVDEENWKF